MYLIFIMCQLGVMLCSLVFKVISVFNFQCCGTHGLQEARLHCMLHFNLFGHCVC
jgi:hypothetical protein